MRRLIFIGLEEWPKYRPPVTLQKDFQTPFPFQNLLAKSCAWGDNTPPAIRQAVYALDVVRPEPGTLSHVESYIPGLGAAIYTFPTYDFGWIEATYRLGRQFSLTSEDTNGTGQFQT